MKSAYDILHDLGVIATNPNVYKGMEFYANQKSADKFDKGFVAGQQSTLPPLPEGTSFADFMSRIPVGISIEDWDKVCDQADTFAARMRSMGKFKELEEDNARLRKQLAAQQQSITPSDGRSFSILKKHLDTLPEDDYAQIKVGVLAAMEEYKQQSSQELIPFDLEKALQHPDKVCCKAKVAFVELYYFKSSVEPYSVTGISKAGNSYKFTVDGKSSGDRNLDLFMQPEFVTKWVNVETYADKFTTSQFFFDTEDEASNNRNTHCVATVPIRIPVH